MIKPIPTDYEVYYRLLTILELRLKSMRYSYVEIKSELDLLADQVIEHFTENWVVDWFEQFLNINASHFGLNHQNTISAMIKYGLMYLKKKDFESAFYLFKDAHQRSTTQYGKDSNQAIFVFETMVDLIKKNDMQLQYEESLVSLYFTYKDLFLDEHPKTKETKAELILQLAGWTTLTGSLLGRPEVITRAESIAIQLPESQRLNAFKSEIYTYFKNAFKENQKHPKAIENLNEMMKQFMERFDVSYDAFNAHLVSHEEYGFQNITEAVFTLNDQVLYCEYATEYWYQYDEAKTIRLADAIKGNEKLVLSKDEMLADNKIWCRRAFHDYKLSVRDCLAPDFNDLPQIMWGTNWM